MQPGDVFRGKIVPYLHPRIVLSFADPAGEIIVVNVTELDTDLDQSCLLAPGDHSLITKASMVYFRLACPFQNEAVDKAIKDNQLEKHAPVTRDLWDRIVDGASKSKAFKPKYKRLLIEQGLMVL